MIQNVKKIYLCDFDLSPITELNGIQTDSVSLSINIKDFDELRFNVDEYIIVNNEKVLSNGYNSLDIYMTLFLEDIGYFQMQKPQEIGDGTKNIKYITAYSLEKELEDKDWLNIKINTGEKDSLEQIADNNLNELGFAKEFVTFFNPEEGKEQLSFIHILLSKLPGWSVDQDDIDPLLWNQKIPSISLDNTNLYNLCVSTIAPRLECLFLFDTLHRKIKVVAKKSLDDSKYETNIFIGYRNLASQISINIDEDSVFTRFDCHGDNDLNILDVNYQDYRIFNIDYFLKSPYMSDELITKVKKWISDREENRDTYVNLSRQWAEAQEASSELNNRVPSDDLNIEQWDDMNEEGLNESLKYYTSLLTSLQISVDPEWSDEYDQDFSDYTPWKKSDGTIDHDRYLDALYNEDNGYGGYYTYYDILHYIIPNINIAINNLSLPKEEKQEYIKDWETNWDLYGVVELDAKLKEYTKRADEFKNYSTSWEDLTDEEKSKYANQEVYELYNSKYQEAATEIENIKKALEFRKTEKQAYDDKMAEVNTKRNDLASMVSLDNPDYGFTSADLITIHSLFHDTDYENTNILSTSIDTISTVIDRELELYEDSINKLSEVSQPQYKFNVELDNLYRIPEFLDWEKQLDILKFIRLGIRDDYSVKLRVIGIDYNPCDISSNLSITFSSMITSRSGRSDLTDLLNSANNRGSKNSYSFGLGDSNTEKEYLTNMLQLMMRTNTFKNTVTNIASGTSGKIDEIEIGKIVTDYIKVSKIDVDQIVGNKASFNELFSKYIDSEYIVTKIITGESGSFIDFVNGHLDIKTISTELITGGDGNTFIDFLNNQIQSSTIRADKITGIEDSKTFIDFVNNQIQTSNLTADVANLKTLLSGTAGIGDVSVIHLTASNVSIDEAVIKKIIAEKLTVADLATHTASADLITLIGENGNPTIAFKNSTQQFYDADGNVRVQIGQDDKGNFNFIVKGVDGKTAMLDENGITQAGIPDNIIINDMIADNTISKNKLGFTAIEANKYGGVDITQVYDGNGNQFGIEYTSFKDNVNNSFTKIDKSIDEKITNAAPYNIIISSSNGSTLTTGVKETILEAHIYKNGTEVTNDFDDSCVSWTRESSDSQGDKYWNEQHNSCKTVKITRNDVLFGAIFKCFLNNN